MTLRGSRASIFRCTFIHDQTPGSVELGFKNLWQLQAKTSSEVIPSSALSLTAYKINPKGTTMNPPHSSTIRRYCMTPKPGAQSGASK